MAAFARDAPLTIQTLFKPDGPLASHIDGFKARAPQLEMAEAVARAIKSGGRLLVEAGTGTGKTYAYLVPALGSGKRVVMSTGSKTCRSSSSTGISPPSRGRSPTLRQWHCSRGAATISASSA